MKIFKKLLTIIPILIFIVSFIIIISATLSLVKGKAPKIFGYSFAIVETNSMEPNYNIGDLVIIKAKNTYLEDDVVTFYYDYYNNGVLVLVTHRIDEINNDEYIMIGDNPAYEGEYQTITSDDIIGKVIKKSAFLGSFLSSSFLSNKQIVFGLITILLLIFIIYQFISIFKTMKTKEDK